MEHSNLICDIDKTEFTARGNKRVTTNHEIKRVLGFDTGTKTDLVLCDEHYDALVKGEDYIEVTILQ